MVEVERDGESYYSELLELCYWYVIFMILKHLLTDLVQTHIIESGYARSVEAI
jgi:hypothetical protein